MANVSFHYVPPSHDDRRVPENSRLQYKLGEDGKPICDENGQPILFDPETDSAPPLQIKPDIKPTDKPSDTSQPTEAKPHETAQPNLTRPNQAAQGHSQTHQSQFAQHAQQNPTMQTQQQFGHQFSSQLSAHQTFVSQAQQAATTLTQKFSLADLPPRLQQALQQEPSPQNYRAILQDPFFQQGPLKNTPLFQKLQQQAKLLEFERQADMRGRDPMNKKELMQLFSARHQLNKEQKDRFNDIMKFEMARTRLEQMKKVQTIHYQTDSHDESKGIDHTADIHETRFDKIRDQILDRLSRSTVLSKFEALLKKVLTGLKLIPDVPDGLKARFALKTEAEWALFFTNLAQLESALTKANVNINDLMDALFRGLFQKGADGKWVLIADLTHLENGELVQNKFAQILLSDKELAATLKKMVPGDVIDKASLKKLGEDIEFIKLLHTIQSTELSDAQKQEILKQYRRSHSEPYTKKIEAALLAHRDGNKPDTLPQTPFVYAGLEPPKKFMRAPGKTKLWIYLLYAGGSFAVALGLYLLLRWVF